MEHNEELSYKTPKVFHFTGKEGKTSTRTATATGVSTVTKVMVHAEVQIVAISFDRAFAALRQRHPGFRVEYMKMDHASRVLIVDEPIAYDVAEKLEC